MVFLLLLLLLLFLFVMVYVGVMQPGCKTSTCALSRLRTRVSVCVL